MCDFEHLAVLASANEWKRRVYITTSWKRIKDCVTVGKQEVKTTAKSMEDTFQRKIGSRRADLIQLTAKTIQMLHLMDDDGNLEVVKSKLAVEFNPIFGEFCELNVSVKWLFQQIVSEKDMSNDRQNWF